MLLHFRRAKSGVLGCGSFRAHRGPWFAKSAFGAVPLLRLSLPSQRSQPDFHRRGDPCGRPCLPPPRGRWHGEAVTDEGGFLKRAPTGFRWTVGTAISRPKAFPWGADSPYQGMMSRSDRGDRDRCPRRGRMRGTALVMWAVRFPRAGLGPALTANQGRFRFCRRGGSKTRPPIP